MLFRLGFLIALTVSGLGIARAQYPFGSNIYQARAATVGESRARGMADLVRSSGYANLQNSEAAINLTQARSQQLDNRVKYAETYYEKRRIRDEAKAYGKNPMTQERAYRIANMQAPKAMNSNEYDPGTGKVRWPLALMQPSMAESRQRVEQLISESSVAGTLSAESYFEVAKLCEGLDDQLNDALKKDAMPMQAISQGKAFLKKLAYAAQKAAN